VRESARAFTKGGFDIGLLLEVDATPGRDGGPAEVTDASPFSSDRVVVAENVPLVIFAGPSHPLVSGGRGRPVRRDDLAGHPLFMSDAAGDFHELVSRYLRADGVPGPHLEASGSVEGVKREVATDPRALGVLPSYAIAEELQSGRVSALEVRPKPPRMRLEGLLSKLRTRHEAAAELLDIMRRSLRRFEARWFSGQGDGRVRLTSKIPLSGGLNRVALDSQAFKLGLSTYYAGSRPQRRGYSVTNPSSSTFNSVMNLPPALSYL
jgi:DNA-binding transcriptional LysR family regulator